MSRRSYCSSPPSPARSSASSPSRDIRRGNGRVGGNRIAVAGIVLSCLSVLLIPLVFLLTAVQEMQSSLRDIRDSNNLMELAVGMQMTHDSEGHFAQGAAFQDSNGKPLLSWRVAVLPYIEQKQLNTRFRLDQPWDSPTTRRSCR